MYSYKERKAAVDLFITDTIGGQSLQTDIAVVVPVYNAAKYLRQCIKSICGQTIKQFVLILVDDGSTDGSSEICDAFAQKDERIRVIHQENRGSVEARKCGVLSNEAQRSKYITLCDADDVMPEDALLTLFTLAEKYHADCVCGNMVKIWKGFRLPQKWKAPCFQLEEAQCYSHQEIIEQLYVSCFGVSNFPVSLWSKLYRTELITKSIDFEPVVQFMGEDLSVTLRVMPQIEKLVITPEVVYEYRIGGGTSKFMPYMLDDFMALFLYKASFAEKYEMPYDVTYLMDIEMMNIIKSYLMMCAREGNYSEEQILVETKKIAERELINQCASRLGDKNETASKLLNGEYEMIEEEVLREVKKQKLTYIAKKMLCKV